MKETLGESPEPVNTDNPIAGEGVVMLLISNFGIRMYMALMHEICLSCTVLGRSGFGAGA